jgi:biopolymer transport protein ExbD
MAEKRRFIDVWLVEPNTVYREVPFNVVTDWVEQSRLLPDDMIRPSGTAQWFRVGDSPEFSPYLPKGDAVRLEDEATALEPVDMGFNWKRPGEDEDQDCDMIPLIDVSLVLLIFFMLTSSTVLAALINTPKTVTGLVADKDRMYYVNVTLSDKVDEITREKIRTPRFSISVGENEAKPVNRELVTRKEAIERLQAVIGDNKGVEVTIRADRNIKSGEIRKLTMDLTRLGAVVRQKFIAVADKVQP